MSSSVATTVLPDHLQTRLSRVMRLVSPTAVEAFDDPALLSEVEILVTGWGCPPLITEALDAAPKLRAVIHAAGTVKGHIGPEVFARGIAVSSAADANADPVAEFTIAAVTLAGKRAFLLARAYAEGNHRRYPAWPGNDGRVIGVIGASRIGRRVVSRLAGLGFRVLVTDPYLDAIDDAEVTGLDDLLTRSDVVTIHAPALPETYHLLDKRRLALLPDGAVLINTARGSIVDTDALTAECAAGRIDAVLDVTDPEPLSPGHQLFALPNVWVTPHLAGAQGTEASRLGEYAVAEVERFISGHALAGAVRADQLSRLA